MIKALAIRAPEKLDNRRFSFWTSSNRINDQSEFAKKFTPKPLGEAKISPFAMP